MNMEWFAEHFYDFLLSLSFASAWSRWQFVGKAWWGQTLWLLGWKGGERMIIWFVRAASSPFCIVLLLIVNIVDQNHCNSKRTFYSSYVLADRVLGPVQIRRKISEIKFGHFSIFHQSSDPTAATAVSILSQVSSRIVFWDASSRSGFWYQCTTTASDTSVPELLLIPVFQFTRTPSGTRQSADGGCYCHDGGGDGHFPLSHCRVIIYFVMSNNLFACIQLYGALQSDISRYF